MKRTVCISLVVFCLAGVGLSLMRDAREDETIYLREYAVMADCLRHGEWFGNEAVGLHGFLSKIPVALLFLVFGQSVFLATFANVLMCMAACLLAFVFMRELLESERWALAGFLLLMGNFQVVMLLATCNRDITALCMILLLCIGVLRGWGRWVLGLVLLLVLDAKEYLYFMTLPAYALWTLMDARMAGQGWGAVLRDVAGRLTAAVVPAAVYLVLMFCTGVVPLNMFAARVFGLAETQPQTTLASQFSPVRATDNRREDGRELGALEPETDLQPGEAGAAEPREAPSPAALAAVAAGGSLALRYAGKLLYPSVFSFDGIPQVLAIPALAMSLMLFRQWWRRRSRRHLFLCVFTWVFLVIFVLMASYPRYMLPLFPILFGFLVLFLRDGMKTGRFALITMLAAGCFVAAGLYFSSAGLWKKIVVNLVLLTALVTVWRVRRGGHPRGDAVAFGVVGLCVVLSLTAFARHALRAEWGQVGHYLELGYNRECRPILDEFPSDARFWINDPGWKHLIDFYRGQRPETPEWQGRLKAWVPKAHLLHRYADRSAHDFWWIDGFDLKKRIRQHGIEWIGLVVCHAEGSRFPYQAELRYLQAKAWARLERTVPFKNKTLYVFRYIEM